MKYQAVILNFDNKTAKYVGVQKAAKLGSDRRVAASRTGTVPPPQQPKR